MPTHIGVQLLWSRRVRVTSAIAAIAALVLLAGDVAKTTDPCSTGCDVASAAHTASPPQPVPPQPAALGVFPKPQAADVDPAAPVSVTANSGTLDDVTLVNDCGKSIPGIMTPDPRPGSRPSSSATAAPTP